MRFVEKPYENRADEEYYTRKYIENMYAFYGYGIWSVIRKSDGRLIGRAGLENREINGRNYLELGYIIAEEFSGNGYAYEICTGILEFVRKHLDVDNIVCVIDEENTPSIKLAEKLGFKFDSYINIDGKVMTCYVI